MPPNTLDPQVKALTMAIRHVESGGKFDARGQSGEYGAYQFTAPTWDRYSREVFGTSIPLEQATPQQQNQVAYTKIKQWKDAGRNIGEVASMWNAGEARANAYIEGNAGVNSSGVSFDTADYARRVAETYQRLKTDPSISETGGVMTGGDASRQLPDYGAWFPADKNDNPLVAGAKAVGNIIPSAYGFGKGIFDAVTHPVETLQGIGRVGIGGIEKLTGDKDAEDINSQSWDAFLQALKDRYGGLEELQNTATNDPFGFGSDVLAVVSAGAGLAGKVSQATGISRPTLYHGADLATAEKIRQGGFIGSKDFPGSGMVSLTADRAEAARYANLGGSKGAVLPVTIAGKNIKTYPSMEAYTKAIEAAPGATAGIKEANLNALFDAVIVKVKGQKDIIFANPKAVSVGAGFNPAGAVSEGIARTGQLLTRPGARAAEGAGRTAAEVAGYGVGKVTGLEPSTMGAIIRYPQEFTRDAIAAGAAGRATLAEEVASTLRDRIDDLGDTGRGYGTIRDMRSPDLSVSDATTKSIPLGGGSQMVYDLVNAPDSALTLAELRKKVQLMDEAGMTGGKATRDLLAAREAAETLPYSVKVPKTWLASELKKIMGVTVGKDGRITSTASSKVREGKDLRALENLYETYQPAFAKGSLTVEEFLNFRADLAKLAKFDREVSKSTVLENLSAIMRGEFNTRFRKSIPDLEALDATYAQQISDLQRLRKGIIDKDGNLNFAAINKIANAKGKGKDLFLDQLEEIMPGIGHRIEIQKAIEDINAASGSKVGTYSKSIVETGATGGIVGGVLTGNIPLIAGSITAMILATPSIAVPLLKLYGMNADLVKQVVNRLEFQNSNAGVFPAIGAGAAALRPIEEAALLGTGSETLALEPATPETVPEV